MNILDLIGFLAAKTDIAKVVVPLFAPFSMIFPVPCQTATSLR